MSGKKAVVLVVAGLCLRAAAIRGELLVQDSFNVGGGTNYTAGNLYGQNPSSTLGWGGAWAAFSGDSTSRTPDVAAGGLVYQVGGEKGFMVGATGGNNGHIVLNASNDRGLRPINGVPSSTNTIWIRTLLLIGTLSDDNNSNNDGVFLHYRRQDTQRLTFRSYDTLGGYPGLTNDCGVIVMYSGSTSTNLATLSTGVTHLVLFKLDIDRAGSNPDSIKVWIDPVSSDEGDLDSLPAGRRAALSFNLFDAGHTFVDFAPLCFTGLTADFLVDEVAIGTVFCDVIPATPPRKGSLIVVH